MSNLVLIEDQFSTICGFRFRNSLFVCWLALGQLVVTALSLGQHIFSLVNFNEIFRCSFNESTHPAFLSADVIIFDFGLMNELIQVQNCVANYLDGGYGRFFWCMAQLGALSIAWIASVCVAHPHPLLLWPALIMQNAYSFGLVILTIATVDKLLLSLLHTLNAHVHLLIVIFFTGTASNYLFTYILWHYYWFLEADFTRRTGEHVLPFWV